jgi:hypothetical protein
MTNALAISLVWLLCACNGNRGEEARTPAPTPVPVPTPAPVPTPGPAPAPAPTEAKPAAPASCELQVTIASNKIDFDGPVSGSVAKAADLHGALAKVDRTCSVVLTVNDTPSYHEIVTALGQLKIEGSPGSRFRTP